MWEKKEGGEKGSEEKEEEKEDRTRRENANNGWLWIEKQEAGELIFTVKSYIFCLLTIYIFHLSRK